MDDKTYVSCDSNYIPDKEFWNYIPGEEMSAVCKVKRKEKLPAKFLISRAISQDGVVSDVYVIKATLDGQMYLNNIIKGPLLKFVRSQRGKGNILFWPDLATNYHHRDVVTFLKKEKIEFVPSNLPRCRPIEKREY